MTQIISLGYALPEYSYTQEEAFRGLGYPRHFRRIFLNSGIDKRHFCIPIERLRNLSFQQQQEEYSKRAIELSKRAAINCLDDRDPSQIACLVYCSCTGLMPGPTAGDYLVRELGLPSSTKVINVSSQGCEGGGYPGLSVAIDFAAASNKAAMVVATELSSLTYFPEPEGRPDPENDYECLRANAIFADASSAALVGV